jgi:hypothetical protein
MAFASEEAGRMSKGLFSNGIGSESGITDVLGREADSDD